LSNLVKFILLISLCVLLLLPAGCSKSSLADIYNNNAKIAESGDSYNFKERMGSNTLNELKLKFKTFYGMETIWIIEARVQGTITFDFETQIKSGKFKAVLISPTKEVMTILDQSNAGSITLSVDKGNNRVKIVGNGATGEVNLLANLNKDIGVIKAQNR
jgi:outer membrane lipoprotein-sorting protein